MNDHNAFPLAYLITFRGYGTWLHGDVRGSIDRSHNIYGTPRIAPNPRLERSDAAQLRNEFITFNPAQRQTIEQAIRAVCRHRQYALCAANVRTNHVHTVVSAPCKPEPVMNAFKSYGTRALRRAGLISQTTKPWVRHGSTRYLWKERHVERAIEYVLYGQGDEPPSFDD